MVEQEGKKWCRKLTIWRAVQLFLRVTQRSKSNQFSTTIRVINHGPYFFWSSRVKGMINCLIITSVFYDILKILNPYRWRRNKPYLPVTMNVSRKTVNCKYNSTLVDNFRLWQQRHQERLEAQSKCSSRWFMIVKQQAWPECFEQLLRCDVESNGKKYFSWTAPSENRQKCYESQRGNK